MSKGDTSNALHGGGCQCGAIRFSVATTPIKVGACHCRMCQRATSAPYAVLAEFNEHEVNWLCHPPALFRSSSHAERGFCSECGTPLTYQMTDSPILELMACAFDNPNDLPPTYAVGIEGRLNWADDLHRLPSKTTEENSGPEFETSLTSYQAVKKG